MTMKHDARMKHKYVVHAPDCEIRHCPICEGGLALCSVCGLAEGSLTMSCPGVVVSSQDSDKVYAGLLDYVDGAWVTQDS
jgi:hypothetical protein